MANFSLTKILSPNSFFEFKGALFWGYVKMDPKAGLEAASHREITNGDFMTGSWGRFLHTDRNRLQFNASLTHYTDDFIKGSHDLMFGVEVERSNVRNRFGYTGTNHIVYWDYAGMNFVAYQYEGYDTKTGYTRLEGFGQDSWQITPRLNINAGLRFSQNWGTVQDTAGDVYKTTRPAPRLGFILDIFSDKKTILKAHYGQFTEAVMTVYHDRLDPASACHDLISLYWDGVQWVEFDRLVHEEHYKFDPNIRHPDVNQITVGLERELFKDASCSTSGFPTDGSSWHLMSILRLGGRWTIFTAAISAGSRGIGYFRVIPIFGSMLMEDQPMTRRTSSRFRARISSLGLTSL